MILCTTNNTITDLLYQDMTVTFHNKSYIKVVVLNGSIFKFRWSQYFNGISGRICDWHAASVTKTHFCSLYLLFSWKMEKNLKINKLGCRYICCKALELRIKSQKETLYNISSGDLWVGMIQSYQLQLQCENISDN